MYGIGPAFLLKDVRCTIPDSLEAVSEHAKESSTSTWALASERVLVADDFEFLMDSVHARLSGTSLSSTHGLPLDASVPSKSWVHCIGESGSSEIELDLGLADIMTSLSGPFVAMIRILLGDSTSLSWSDPLAPTRAPVVQELSQHISMHHGVVIEAGLLTFTLWELVKQLEGKHSVAIEKRDFSLA
jgi:hypothetical protein